MKIPIIFLGTSSGIPTSTRNHTSILLSYKSEKLLIDCGEGTQRQMRKAKINPCKITRLLITHAHGDHIFGLPGFFQTLALNGYEKTLYIYGPKGTKKLIENIFKVFILTKKIKFKVEEVKGKFLDNNDFTLSATALEHDIPTNGYVFQEKDKLRIHKDKLNKLKIKNHPDLGKLTQGKDIKIDNKTIKSKDLTYPQKGRKISFIFDTKLCPNVRKLAKDADLAIMEATFLSDSKEGDSFAKEYKHMTVEEACNTAKKSNTKELALTHFSQRYEFKEKLLSSIAKKIFPKTTIAKDFLTIEV